MSYLAKLIQTVTDSKQSDEESKADIPKSSPNKKEVKSDLASQITKNSINSLFFQNMNNDDDLKDSDDDDDLDELTPPSFTKKGSNSMNDIAKTKTNEEEEKI